jgi:alanyl-tRNA synthetase
MSYTERLYFGDSRLLDFTATVLSATPVDDRIQVVLDRTAFYPTGGGQPNDTGTLNGSRVIDVFEDEEGAVVHVLENAGGLGAPNQQVRGLVDSKRRLDHLQQHSGQHILSQAFVRACGAETRSFHLGAAASTIDIDLPAPTPEHMTAAEDLANAVLFEDRPMLVHLLDEAEAEKLPLRKESAVRGRVRVIEVDDFDWSPCGGTHAARTGEIGLIAIKSYEKVRKLTRVEFVCGLRALADYRLAHRTATSVARLLSAERDSTPELVAAVIGESKTLKKRVRDLLGVALAVEAAELLAAAPQAGAFKIVSRVFNERNAEELRLLASRIVQSEPAVALLGSNDGGAAKLAFARSESVSHNMGELIAEACLLLGGRGGGKGDVAQGGGPDPSNLEQVIQLAAEKLKS